MKDFIKYLKLTWKYSKNQKKNIIGFLLCNIIHIIISIVLPIVSAKIIVNLTNNKLDQVLFIGFVLFLISTLRSGLNYLSTIFSNLTYRELFTTLQLELGKSILKLENSCIDKNSSGVFIQRLSTDTSKIADIFNLLSYYTADVLTNIGIFGAILIIDFRIFLYVFIVVFVIALFEKKRVSIRNENDKEFRKIQENVSGFAGELVRGVRDIKMLSAEKSFIKELKEKLINLNQKRYDMTKVNREYIFFADFLRNTSDLILIGMLIYFIQNNELEIAMALVVYNYMGNVTYMINSYGFLMEGVKDFKLSASRIFDIISGSDFPKEKFGKKHIAKVNGDFEFDKVSFSYGKENSVLNDLSFKVKANQTIAFVGKSGAGKTTIFNLLCKMYSPNSGTITIDGINIEELDKESIRDNITIISQNPYIFNLSIRDNLKLVKENLTDEEMIKACKAACLDEFINSLPDKYDTVVGEGGISLSGGQRQRLAIARALVQKTEIILFDEATSALDNETQAQIQEAIENLKEEYTILIIAHRLSTIINSDRILFLEDGKVQDEGTHEELLKRCKDYKKLYEAEIEK